MVVRVKVGGIWLDSRYQASNPVDSTIYRTDAWSGDYQASVDWAAPANLRAGWLHEGADYRHVEGGETTWRGYVSEVEESDDHLTIHAVGYGAQTDDYRSLSVVGGDLVPTAVPDTGWDQAVDDGLPIARYSSLGTTAVKVDEESELMSITTLLARRTKALGQRWWVDSFPEITFVADPTSPTWIVQPRSAYMGTADDQFVTHLYGLYVKTVDGTTGLPTSYGVVIAGDDEAAEQFGRRSYDVDLTALGMMTEAAAQANVDGRFALVGARMGWTNGIEIVPGMLRRLANGAVASPLSMYGHRGAGSMLRIPGITDTRSQPTTRGSIDVILGEVTRYHDDRRVEVLPVGYTPRDFEGALAPAVAPDTSEAA